MLGFIFSTTPSGRQAHSESHSRYTPEKWRKTLNGYYACRAQGTPFRRPRRSYLPSADMLTTSCSRSPLHFPLLLERQIHMMDPVTSTISPTRTHPNSHDNSSTIFPTATSASPASSSLTRPTGSIPPSNGRSRCQLVLVVSSATRVYFSHVILFLVPLLYCTMSRLTCTLYTISDIVVSLETE